MAALSFFALWAVVYSSILEGEGKSELETSSSSSFTVEGAFGLLNVAGVDDSLRVERLVAVPKFVSTIAQMGKMQRGRERVAAASNVRKNKEKAPIRTRCSRSSEATAEAVNLPRAASGSSGRCHLGD